MQKQETEGERATSVEKKRKVDDDPREIDEQAHREGGEALPCSRVCTPATTFLPTKITLRECDLFCPSLLCFSTERKKHPSRFSFSRETQVHTRLQRSPPLGSLSVCTYTASIKLAYVFCLHDLPEPSRRKSVFPGSNTPTNKKRLPRPGNDGHLFMMCC